MHLILIYPMKVNTFYNFCNDNKNDTATKSRYIYTNIIRLTLLQVRRHAKQNWWRQESVNDLFLHVPRHIAQLGGGELEPLSRCGLLSSLLTLLGFAPELSSCAVVDSASISMVSYWKFQYCSSSHSVQHSLSNRITRSSSLAAN